MLPVWESHFKNHSARPPKADEGPSGALTWPREREQGLRLLPFQLRAQDWKTFKEAIALWTLSHRPLKVIADSGQGLGTLRAKVMFPASPRGWHPVALPPRLALSHLLPPP